MVGHSFFNIIILLGSIQGLVMSVLLFFFEKKRFSNRLLGVLIFLIALAGFNLYADSVNWFKSSFLQFISQVIPLIIIMPVGPLVYFYIRSYTDPSFRVSGKRKLHFLPVIIDILPNLIVIYYICGLILNAINRNPKPYIQFIDTYNVYSDIPRWCSLTIYLLLSYRYIKSVKLTKAQAGKLEKDPFKWLFQLVRAFLVFQVIWLIYLIPYTMPEYTNWMLDTFWWYPVYVPLSFLIYYLGLKGYINAQNQSAFDKKEAMAYAAMSDEAVAKIEMSLKESMEKDRHYLDPNLNLNSLSSLTSIDAKAISTVLNSSMHIGFNEFVNQYRIEAIKNALFLPESEKLTITGIAFNCGFNSQATFQRAFKQVTGLSPSEYKRGLKKQQSSL